MAFPKGFVWGAAAASYQVEGAAYEDGKGPSVWDMMCRKDGAVWSGQTGDVACDHYHRYAEDAALMRELGLKAYRLSLSWPRIMPEGEGAVNAKGLDFYDRLIDALLAAGVAPWVTLFHWDYPYALYCRGGWLSRASADWFAAYADVVVRRLGDRVTHWMTQNEPQCYIGLGLWEGRHAPGDRLGWAEVLRAAHHSMLGHGKAVQAMRAATPQPCRIGFAPVGVIKIPATAAAADVEAARAEMFAVRGRSIWNNTWWMDPVLLGRYPEDGLAAYAGALPPVEAGDLETMRQPLDFFGTNIYNGAFVQAGAGGPENVPYAAGFPLTAFKWPVTPDALYWGPRFFQERYGLPVVVTENGLSGADWVGVDGRVHDGHRIDFTTRYLRALGRAIDDGVDVRGYFHWSIMDNFEWAEGFKERFGLVHVDYETQKRTPKDSARWYAGVIAANGANL
jgi:beta-glucosidase